MAILELSAEQIYELARQLPTEERESLVIRLQIENNFDTATAPQPRTPGRYKDKIWISPDFDAPLPDDIQAYFE